MKKLIVGFLMFALIFGTAAITKAADFGVHFGKDHDRYYDNFGSWETSQRDRINDARRDNMISRSEYDRLNREVSRVEAFHNEISDRGRISDRDRDRLERMEARVNSDIEREISEHRY